MSKNRGVVYIKPGLVEVHDIDDPKFEDPQGRVKRVASAVGEGSVVVQAVHHYLAGLREAGSAESSQ